MQKGNFAGKKVLVMGLGRFGGGVDVVKFLAAVGAEVKVTDLASAEELKEPLGELKRLDVDFRLGCHEEQDFRRTDVIVVNPAVPPGNRYVQISREAGAVVTSQVEMFFSACPAEIIGITGANGKSTTAALTAHLLRSASDERRATSDEYVWLSGNIGNEPMLTVLDEIDKKDLVVLELSSFQIEQLNQSGLAPAVGLLTNMSTNHLDRYGTFEKYCAAKEGMFENQVTDEKKNCVSIFNIEDGVGQKWFEKYSGDAGRECIGFSADDLGEGFRETFSLPGRANLSNLAGAVAVCRYFGVADERMLSVLSDFKGLAHRLELICESDGVRWYNDSKSTTPESAIAAVEAFEEPPILIAGGYDKGLSFDELGKTVAEKTKAAILIGQTAKKIASSIKSADKSLRAKLVPNGRSNRNPRDTKYETRDTKVEIIPSLEEAVKFAHSIAVKGDVVLLSPACASYDMFRNYEHRGEEFVKLVRECNS